MNRGKAGKTLENGGWSGSKCMHRVVERILQVGDTVGSSVTNPARLE